MEEKIKHLKNEKREIYYWSESICFLNLTYNLTAASTGQGLCWLGLGNKEDEESELFTWSKRWFFDWILLRKREPNLRVIEETTEYLKGLRREFTLPLHQVGTSFQLKVWEQLLKIPYGTTLSYSEVGERINCPLAQRAVGMANNKNPIAIVVPCHRVIGKNGSLTGYAGGLNLKEKLLMLEKEN